MTLTVSAVNVTMTPAGPLTLGPGATQQLTATIAGSANQAVTWTVSPTGLVTAPACITAPQTVTVRATSMADPAQSGAVTINLSAQGAFTGRRALVVNSRKVPAPQTNFPVLLNLTDSNLKSLANGGKVTSATGTDLIFASDATCATKLDFEIENWNAATGALTAWAKLPALSSTTDTPFYLCYGNAAVTTDQSNKAGVWAGQHTAVYHLPNGTTLTANDSAGTFHGAIFNATAAAGLAHGAAALNGTNGYIVLPPAAFNFPASGTTANYPFSFSVWFKTAASGVILGQQPGAVNTGLNSWVPALYIGTDGKLYASVFNPSTNARMVTAARYNDNNWHQAVSSYNAGVESLYVDGVLAGQQTVNQVGGTGFFYQLGTGVTSSYAAAPSGWNYFNGQLDEARIAATPRSAEWIATEYNNLAPSGNFLYLLPENAPVVVTPPTAPLYANQTQQFAAAASSCAAGTVLWTATPSGFGTLSPTGFYTAPVTITAPQAVTITAAYTADNTVAGTATIMLYPPVTVGITPATATLAMGPDATVHRQRRQRRRLARDLDHLPGPGHYQHGGPVHGSQLPERSDAGADYGDERGGPE